MGPRKRQPLLRCHAQHHAESPGLTGRDGWGRTSHKSLYGALLCWGSS